MRGNYIDTDGRKFEVTQQDTENKIVYAFHEGSGQWYPESVYGNWRKSDDISVATLYEPEALVEKLAEEIIYETPVESVPQETLVEEVLPEPIPEIPEVIEEAHAINEVGEDAVVLPPKEEVVEEKPKVKKTTKKKTK